MKIGVLGGTFDPPHLGHIALAKAAKAELELDEILWIPAHRNPLKPNHPAASSKERFEMVQLSIRDHPGFSVSDIETRRKGPSYMVDTLMELKEVVPGDYWLLLGLDSALSFANWKNYSRILKMARIGCVLRSAHDWTQQIERFPLDVQPLLDPIPMDAVDISSTEIRVRIAEGRSINHLVSPQVADFIRKNALYRPK